jgi:hypothetical protein
VVEHAPQCHHDASERVQDHPAPPPWRMHERPSHRPPPRTLPRREEHAQNRGPRPDCQATDPEPQRPASSHRYSRRTGRRRGRPSSSTPPHLLHRLPCRHRTSVRTSSRGAPDPAAATMPSRVPSHTRCQGGCRTEPRLSPPPEPAPRSHRCTWTHLASKIAPRRRRRIPTR